MAQVKDNTKTSKQDRSKKDQNKTNQDKIRWACRRGMLELDKILLDLFDKVNMELTSSKKDAFEKLLKENDTDLQKWLIGDEISNDHEIQDLILFIRHFASASTVNAGA